MRILNIEHDISFSRYGMQFQFVGAGHLFLSPGVSCSCYYTPFVTSPLRNAYEFILQHDCPYHGPWHVEVEVLGSGCWNRPPQLQTPPLDERYDPFAAPSAIKLPVAPTEMK